MSSRTRTSSTDKALVSTCYMIRFKTTTDHTDFTDTIAIPRSTKLTVSSVKSVVLSNPLNNCIGFIARRPGFSRRPLSPVGGLFRSGRRGRFVRVLGGRRRTCAQVAEIEGRQTANAEVGVFQAIDLSLRIEPGRMAGSGGGGAFAAPGKRDDGEQHRRSGTAERLCLAALQISRTMISRE